MDDSIRIGGAVCIKRGKTTAPPPSYGQPDKKGPSKEPETIRVAGYDVVVPSEKGGGVSVGGGEGESEGRDGGGDLFELESRNSELRKYRGLDPDGKKEEGDTLTVDCFPDEAIGMALAAGAPIYVERAVWEAAAIPASR